MAKKARYENRTFSVADLRVEKRGDGEGEGHVLRGHAAVFDVLSHPLFFFREKIDPGAFTESIKNDDIRALWMHDPQIVLGRNTSSPSTLSLREDDTGLQVEIDLPDTQAGRDAKVSVDRGDVREMSFGFFTVDDSWETAEGEQIRTLKTVQLLDVSPVSFPQYPSTDVAVAARFMQMQQQRGHGDGVDVAVLARAVQELKTTREELRLLREETRARLDVHSRRFKLADRAS